MTAIFTFRRAILLEIAQGTIGGTALTRVLIVVYVPEILDDTIDGICYATECHYHYYYLLYSHNQ